MADEQNQQKPPADEQKQPAGEQEQPVPVNILNPNLGNIGIIGILQTIDIKQVLSVIDTATNLTTIDQYNQLKPQLVKADGDLKTYLTRQDAQISDLTNQVSALSTQITTLQGQNTDLNNQVTALKAQVAQLQAQLASAPKTASPLHVAQSFKNVVDQIQADARNNPGVQTTISNMQIAVKALVNVQPGTGPSPTSEAMLVFPDPSQPPDPNLLSTLTLNFAAIPNVKRAPTTTTPTGGATPIPPGAMGGTQPPSAQRPDAAKPVPSAQPLSPEAQQRTQSFAERLRRMVVGLRRPDTGPE